MNNVIKNRYDFVYLFDVKDGNPNGDPDQANLPRADAENQQGLVTDVCIKRKVRNYVALKYELQSPYDIFIRQDAILANEIANVDVEDEKNKKKQDVIKERQTGLCEKFYDIRTFGAVLAVGDKPSGTIRGPVQLTFARSEDRIYQAEHSITRCAVTTEKEAKAQENREHASTFGRKSTVPYALYRMHGFISAVDAVKSGFSDNDLELLWESLLNAFEHDRSAARGEMNPRKLIVFKHESHLGNARSGELFDKVKIKNKSDLPRSFEAYEIVINKEIPSGIQLVEKL
ncbi:type I-C CRISPR-associated protein Cas7/Csd2 [bacterium]|nr:type I-C CRISPR-associated protein Cas7/Csd2 [bacterium]